MEPGRDSRRLRRGLATFVAASLLGVALAMPACRTTVVPPEHPADPVSVYLVDLGRTSGLVLPDEQGRLVEFVYGEWDWYALRQTGVVQVIPTLLWPTQGTLGRGELGAAPGAGSPAVADELGAQEVLEVRVAGARVRDLHARLEDLFEQNAAGGETAGALGLRFVKHPRAYSAAHNSNHRTAAWLAELDCGIRGIPIFSRWRVDERSP